MKEMLRNGNTVLEFDPERKEISGSDLKDQCNAALVFAVTGAALPRHGQR